MNQIEKLKNLIKNLPILDEPTKQSWINQLAELSTDKLNEFESLIEETYKKLTRINKDFNLKLINFTNMKILPAIRKNEKKSTEEDLKTTENILNQF